MKTADYFFELPEGLIAKYPPEGRGDSRLMVLECGSRQRQHCMVKDLPAILSGPAFRGKNGRPPLLVFNNSRVRKARLLASPMALAPGRPAGSGSVYGGPPGEAEFLLLYRIDSRTWKTLVNRSKKRRPGCRYRFAAGVEGEIIETPPDVIKDEAGESRQGEAACQGEAARQGETARQGGVRYVRFNTGIDDDWLDIHGHVPLPPYIKRGDESSDGERYQTIYANRAAAAALGPGASVAAPTAGLHFTGSLFDALDAAEVERVFITLHVGLGTFLPVRSEKVEDHIMHEEPYSISDDAAQRINAAKRAGRKIIAVGTTAVRTLESACGDTMQVHAGEGSTQIFIYQGYRFKITDAIFTNFHTPSSTLLMLVSAFAGARAGASDVAGPVDGRQLIMESYAEAIGEQYRFFSYGDAMLIH